MKNIKLNLLHKLGAGYLLVAASLLVCAVVGLSAAGSLSSTLNYVTQNAWDAADGAMEGTIEIEAELLVLDRILLNVITIEEGIKEIKQASERGAVALSRMENSGLMEAGEVDELHRLLADFRGQRDSIIDQFRSLNENRKKADENMAEFDALLSELEETIETTLEGSNLNFVGSEELLTLWDVANGTMETRLGLLIRSQAFNLLMAANDRTEQQAIMNAGLEQARDRIGIINDSEYANYKTADGSTYQRAIAQLLSEHEQAYVQAVNSYFQFVDDKARLDDTITQLLEKIAAIEESGDSKVESTVDNIVDTIAFSKSSIIASAIFGLFLAIISFLYSMRAIVKPIRDIAQRLSRIGEEGGDLTQRLDVRGHDEIAGLSSGFNRFMDKIGEIIDTVKQSSSQVHHSAGELSSITALASDGASQQSLKNSAIATAVEEMSTSAEQIAESAASAAQETSNADSSAQQGKSIVSQSIKGIQTLSDEVSAAAQVINNLEQEADSIGSVLDVIRSIAEQTNLLALNAAIEAARAGEQGRGFAVVADEVRTLASRTQQSTEEIQAMIESLQGGTKQAVAEMDKSCKQAETTVQRAIEAGKSLDEIVSAVTQINETNNQIAHSAGEQKKTAAEVSQNVLAIQSVSEQTADNSKKAQNTSAEVATQAELLQGLMQQFQTTEKGSG